MNVTRIFLRYVGLVGEIFNSNILITQSHFTIRHLTGVALRDEVLGYKVYGYRRLKLFLSILPMLDFKQYGVPKLS